MGLPETKVKQQIGLMNSVSNDGIPPQSPILELFDLAMDEPWIIPYAGNAGWCH